jgi:hypothetical protein
VNEDHINLILQRYSGVPKAADKLPADILVGRYLSKVLSPRDLHGKKILEIGAGCSQYVDIFLQNSCSTYYANDLVPARLRVSRVADPRYRELTGDFLKIDVPERVDIVFANLTMMMVVPMFDEFAEKVASVLSAGGIFLSMDANYYCPLSIVRRFTDRKANPVRLFSPHRLASIFSRHGMTTEALVPFTARFPWTTGNWLFGTVFWLKARKLPE